MKSFLVAFNIEHKLFWRGFFGPFFTLVFPLLMLFLYGSIFGNEPDPVYGGYGAMDVSIPSYCAMVIAVTGIMVFPLTMAEYKSKKVYKRLDATSQGKNTVILAQLAVNVLMSVIGIGLLVIGGLLFYNVQIDGNPFIIAPILLLGITNTYSFGFLLSAIAPDYKTAHVLCYLTYFIMIFVSGTTIPIERFPESLQTFAKILPLTYVTDVFRAVFAGKPMTDYVSDIVIVAVLGLTFSAIAIAINRRKRWD
ncbi:ABC transporter permease [Granulicatella seriolae]|uniref:Transport permease protein n=1 Tax=Granulicatella seriolae TaxID=2967226 RepID=A0ABT1WNA5_9LACT|nr:ABC transporter permease [Granulicatella seriolae]